MTFLDIYCIIILSWVTYPARAKIIFNAGLPVESEEQLMLSYSFIRVVLLVTTYFALMAIFGSRVHCIFTLKASICFMLGCVLGGFIGAPLFNSSDTAGFIGIGIGIAIMYILFYTGIVPAIIRIIPETFKKVVKNIFNVLKYILIVAIIIGVVALILNIWIH